MEWEKGATSVTFTPADMKVMHQCGISLGDIVKSNPNAQIPPLGSVLAYVMLRNGGTVGDIWACYRHLKEMQEEISRYYYFCRIPKANGDVRGISVPLGVLQAEQNYILQTVLSGLPVDSHAYAYRKDVSIQACAAPHVRQEVVIHLDIRNFFGSITEKRVVNVLMETTGYPKSLCRLLARLCCLNGRLPQGAPTSPMLSNIVFRPCDETLAKLAESFGLRYTRYSDDLYFSGAADTDVKLVLQTVSRILLSHGFRIHSEKTSVRRPQHRQSVLGLTVNDRLQVNRTYRRQLEQELYYLERYAERCKGALEAGDYLRYMQQLHGRLAYVLQTDPEDPRLRKAHQKLSQQIKRYTFLADRGFLP